MTSLDNEEQPRVGYPSFRVSKMFGQQKKNMEKQRNNVLVSPHDEVSRIILIIE
jgi:hypothetical protein